MGQRMPEPEAVPVGHDQLQPHPSPQRRDHARIRQAGYRAQQRPVEPPPQHRGRVDNPAGIRIQPVKAPAYYVREGGRDPDADQVSGLPAAIALGQRAVPDQAGQDLLDQERQSLGPFCDQGLDRAWQLGAPDAGQRHPSGGRRIQPIQRQHSRRSARLQHPGQRGRLGAFLIPHCAHAQHPLPGQVVSQVLQQG